MHIWSRRSVIRPIAGAVVAAWAIGLLDVTDLAAQQPAPSADSAFLSNPGQLLQQNPNGGGRLISGVRELSLCEAPVLNAVLGLLPGANAGQKSAIGTALAQAAQIALPTNQQCATSISEGVAASNDSAAKVAYTAIAGDQATLALGGILGGGGGGGQSNPLGGPPSSTGPTQSSGGGGGVPRGQFSFTSSVTGASGTSGSSKISQSVSPF